MRLATLFGIDIRLNTFFLLMFILYWHYGILVQALILFTIVFLHELGHVSVTLGYGIKVREIELLPFGGVARTEGGMEADPVVEAYVSLAGPLTNAFLALAGYMLQRFGVGNQQWLPFFIQSNIVLGLFNLLPAFPLDGGRVLRACLARQLGLKRATETALALAKAVSIVMAGLGIWSVVYGDGSSLNFLVIAFFLIYAAAKEKGAAMYLFMKFLMRKKGELFREGILLARQVVAQESSCLKDVVKYFVPKKYHLVVVVGRDQKILGTLTEGQVIEAMLKGGPETPVGHLIGVGK